MSLTDTARHWLCGCALWTAASRSAVKVAMPHLRGKWSPTKAILRTLDVSFIKHLRSCDIVPGPCSGCLDGAILRLPHRVLHLLNNVAELDSGEAFRVRRLGDGHRYGHRHAAQVVNMRQQRRPELAHSHQARHATRRRREHAVTDPIGSRDDSAETQAGVQHGIVHLRDDVGYASIG